MKTTMVREWMTPNPISASPKTTLPEAQRLLQEYRIRRLPVVKDGKLVGIVTLGDLRGAQPSEATSLSVYELHYLVAGVTIDRIMTKDPVTVSPTQTVFEAARLMLHYKIGGLPVVEDGMLVGILTESDVFRMAVGLWEKEDHAVSS